ncbi:MAG: hypothetical protein E6J91_02660, partial [Deltaproteobacteria bacterium]
MIERDAGTQATTADDVNHQPDASPGDDVNHQPDATPGDDVNHQPDATPGDDANQPDAGPADDVNHQLDATQVGDACRAMLLARQVDADQAIVGSLNAAARRLGITLAMGKGYRKLLKLGADLQHEIIEGRAPGVSLARLYAVAKLPEGEAQRHAFDRARIMSPAALPKRARS